MPRYILFNKPYGVLSQFTGEGPTLADYIAIPEIYPVGRLDRDSEGLMLLTGDGRLQHRLSDPRYAHPRTYAAQVEGVPTAGAIRALESGIPVQDYITRPAKVRVLDEEPGFPPRQPPIRYRKEIPTTWIELILTEGRNRQVRRMTAAAGYPTLRLVRTAIGELQLGDLAPGRYRNLTADEMRRFDKLSPPCRNVPRAAPR